jgi:hypothetical protein
MDSRLEERLTRLSQQIDKLRQAELSFLTLDAHKRVLAAQLFLTAEGKSIAEREANVYSSKDWQDFIVGHVDAESTFNHERRRYELQLKAYDAAHLTLKTEAPVIKRQGA